MLSTRYSCHTLMTLEISRQIFKKSLNIKLNENPSSGSPFVPCAQMDGQTDMTNLIVSFCNSANAPKTVFRN